MMKHPVLLEKVENIITELIHHTDELPNMNYSDYLSENLRYNYNYLSNIFSEEKGITIRGFIIEQKIEMAKELMLNNELNLTEISYKLHYSSVAHLSNQFKNVTGLSPSDYKQSPSYYKQLKDKKRNTLAKKLLEKYKAPMANLNLTTDEARAILEYFRKND